MAIIFPKEKIRVQEFLFFLLLLLFFVIIFVIGWRLTTKKILPEEMIVPKPVGTVKINFEILRDPLLQILQPIEKIPPLENEVGRTNPFLPYSPLEKSAER